MNIEIRAVDNGFILVLTGDKTNPAVKKTEKVAGSLVELVGVIAGHCRDVYGKKFGNDGDLM